MLKRGGDWAARACLDHGGGDEEPWQRTNARARRSRVGRDLRGEDHLFETARLGRSQGGCGYVGRGLGYHDREEVRMEVRMKMRRMDDDSGETDNIITVIVMVIMRVVL